MLLILFWEDVIELFRGMYFFTLINKTVKKSNEII